MLAGITPTMTEWRLMPNTVAQALVIVNGWRQEEELEHQVRMMEAMVGRHR
jgi:hypothetical protein